MGAFSLIVVINLLNRLVMICIILSFLSLFIGSSGWDYDEPDNGDYDYSNMSAELAIGESIVSMLVCCGCCACCGFAIYICVKQNRSTNNRAQGQVLSPPLTAPTGQMQLGAGGKPVPNQPYPPVTPYPVNSSAATPYPIGPSNMPYPTHPQSPPPVVGGAYPYQPYPATAAPVGPPYPTQGAPPPGGPGYPPMEAPPPAAPQVQNPGHPMQPPSYFESQTMQGVPTSQPVPVTEPNVNSSAPGYDASSQPSAPAPEYSTDA